MDGVRQIAYAYYEKATQEEINLVLVLFTELDINGDGKISLAEFKTYMSTKADPHRLSDFFKLLNANGDGMLEFPDVVTCFYIRKYDLCAGWRNCEKCSCVLLSVPYFSCSLCDYPDIYELCCACYREGRFKHKHSYEFFKDNYSSLGDRGKKSEITNGKDGKNAVDELRDIAKCHYRAGSPEVQQLAYEFFQSMDYDGDGKVDLHEFLAFMRQEGHVHMRNSYFFRELDHDGNGTLDFSEVMTLYYIIKSKRPFCDCCGKFIPGVYFLCVKCFNIPGASFTLCCDCYRSPSSRCSHEHDGRTQFLDNYTLLQAKNDVETTLVNQDEGLSHLVNTSQAIVPTINPNWGGVCMNNESSYITSYTNLQGLPHPPKISHAIVPAHNSKWSKCSTALKLLEVAVHIGIASASCTIL